MMLHIYELNMQKYYATANTTTNHKKNKQIQLDKTSFDYRNGIELKYTTKKP